MEKSQQASRKITSLKKDRTIELPDQFEIQSITVAKTGPVVTAVGEYLARYLFVLNEQGDVIQKFECIPHYFGMAACPGTNQVIMAKADDRDPKLLFIDTELSELGKEVKIMDGDGFSEYSNIAISENKMYLACNYDIVVCDMDVTILEKIEISKNARPHFYMLQFKRDMDGNFYYTDDQKLQKLSKEGEPLFTFAINETCNRGCEIDNNGNVYVTEWNDDRSFLYQVSPEGELITDKLCDQPIPEDSTVMSFNQDFSELYVVSRNIISVYACVSE